MIRHLKHPKRRLNEQSHPELRHKIQCERCFSSGGSETRTGGGEGGGGQLGELWEFGGAFKVQDVVQKKCLQIKWIWWILIPAAAEKHRLRIIIIIMIVIIIILWYNKDIWLPFRAQWGVQWFAVAMVQWSPPRFAVGSTRLSVNQPSVRSLQGWEGLNEGVIQLPLTSNERSVQRQLISSGRQWHLLKLLNPSNRVRAHLPLVQHGINGNF